MELIKPCKKYKTSYFKYIEEVRSNEELNKLGDANINDKETFDEMLDRVDKISKKENLTGIMKPTTVFWMVDKNEVIGSMNLRHELNQWTYYTIGNVGYYVKPSKRNMGYATKALNKAIDFYKSINQNKILIVCTESNISSQKVIEKNGGKYEMSIPEYNSNETLKRYWISCK